MDIVKRRNIRKKAIGRMLYLVMSENFAYLIAIRGVLFGEKRMEVSKKKTQKKI